MKKLIAILLCICMLFSMAACGGGGGGKDNPPSSDPKQNESQNDPSQGNDNPGKPADNPAPAAEHALVQGTENTVDGFGKFSLIKIITTDRIAASHAGRVIESKDGNVFADAVFSWTNTGNESVYSSDLMTVSATDASGKTYEGNVAVETEDNGGMPQANAVTWGDIAPDATTRIHCNVSVPSNAGNIEFRFVIQNQTYKISYKVGETVTTAKQLKIGDTLEEPGFARLTFRGITFDRQLLPADTSGSYYSMGVQGVNSANETFLIAKFDATNLMDSEQDCKVFMGMTAQFGDYRTFSAGMYDDCAVIDSRIDIPGLFSTFPGSESKTYYYLLQIPQEYATQAMTLTVTFAGKDYVYQVGDHEIIKAPDPIVPLSRDSLKVGAVVGFGTYEQDNDTGNGPEPIEWKVLDNVDGYWLLISKYGLDVQPFHHEYRDVTWDCSDIRSWLNTTFRDTAFSAADLAKIEARNVPVLVGSNSKLNYGVDTIDQVFLLSRAEADKYFPTNEEKQCGATEYAYKAKEALVETRIDADGRPGCSWWLRNHTDNPAGAGCIWEEGIYNGGTVDNNHTCIRPAIWIKAE